MARVDLSAKLKPNDIGNPAKEDVATTVTMIQGMQRLKEVDEQAYNAIMDMYEGEIRGMFAMVMSPSYSDAEVVGMRREMITLGKMVSLIDQREQLYLSPGWHESMVDERAADKKKLDLALELRRESLDPSRSRGRGMS